MKYPIFVMLCICSLWLVAPVLSQSQACEIEDWEGYRPLYTEVLHDGFLFADSEGYFHLLKHDWDRPITLNPENPSDDLYPEKSYILSEDVRYLVYRGAEPAFNLYSYDLSNPANSVLLATDVRKFTVNRQRVIFSTDDGLYTTTVAGADPLLLSSDYLPDNFNRFQQSDTGEIIFQHRDRGAYRWYWINENRINEINFNENIPSEVQFFSQGLVYQADDGGLFYVPFRGDPVELTIDLEYGEQIYYVNHDTVYFKAKSADSNWAMYQISADNLTPIELFDVSFLGDYSRTVATHEKWFVLHSTGVLVSVSLETNDHYMITHAGILYWRVKIDPTGQYILFGAVMRDETPHMDTMDGALYKTSLTGDEIQYVAHPQFSIFDDGLDFFFSTNRDEVYYVGSSFNEDRTRFVHGQLYRANFEDQSFEIISGGIPYDPHTGNAWWSDVEANIILHTVNSSQPVKLRRLICDIEI